MLMSNSESPRHKLFAITFSDIQKCRSTNKTSRSPLIEIPNSSDKEMELRELPARKKRRHDNRLEGLADDVVSVKKHDYWSDVSDSEPYFACRLEGFCYTFKCQVCHAIPINPPVIIIKFCRNILRCEECVNTWYSGLDAMMKTCPVCHRSELIACEQTFSI